MENWDVIIVGAGYGGLCSGALLAHAGKKVLVIERDKIIGGRAGSIMHAGQVLDDGAHIPSQAGHLESIFADLGIPYPDRTAVQPFLPAGGRGSETAHRGAAGTLRISLAGRLRHGRFHALRPW